MTTTVPHHRGETPAASAPARPTLRLLSSPGVSPRLFSLTPGECPLGREVQRGVALPSDERVSRLHAVLEVSPDLRVVTLARCPGRNGTLVGGRQVTGPLRLADGDLLRVGDSFLLFRASVEPERDGDVPELVGVSPAIALLRHRLVRAAPDRAAVLLQGETGTGKEVAASALHRMSGRRGAFLAVNCSAIPAELAESQLFGHVTGAFTGARAQPGLFRAADGGTLFLDEIGDLPASLQPKLLRALEQGAVLPVGATAQVACDVRVLAASHKNLEIEIAAGRFRADLFARLADLILELAPLRSRREDVLLLLAHAGIDAASLPADVIELLLLHAWPMNVREVFKVASHLRVFGPDDALRARLAQPPAAPGPSLAPAAAPAPAPEASRRPGRLVQPTRGELEALLLRHQGVILDVSRELGCSRRQVGRWIDELGIDRARFRLVPEGDEP